MLGEKFVAKNMNNGRQETDENFSMLYHYQKSLSITKMKVILSFRQTRVILLQTKLIIKNT